jgi:DNA-binding transcriptional ArsR family regulator
VSQPAISQHLRVLRNAGLVASKRTGRGAVYHLQAKPLEEVYAWAERFREVSDPSGHVRRLTANKGE